MAKPSDPRTANAALAKTQAQFRFEEPDAPVAQATTKAPVKGPGVQKNPYKAWDVTTLAPDDEARFQADMQSAPGFSDWRKEFEGKYKEAPNYDHPENDYDYRGAWKNGMRPEVYKHDGTYHWESKTPGGDMLKSPEHPTAWMQSFVEATDGKDPNEAGVKNEAEGRAYVEKNGGTWPASHFNDVDADVKAAQMVHDEYARGAAGVK